MSLPASFHTQNAHVRQRGTSPIAHASDDDGMAGTARARCLHMTVVRVFHCRSLLCQQFLTVVGFGDMLTA